MRYDLGKIRRNEIGFSLYYISFHMPLCEINPTHTFTQYRSKYQVCYSQRWRESTHLFVHSRMITVQKMKVFSSHWNFDRDQLHKSSAYVGLTCEEFHGLGDSMGRADWYTILLSWSFKVLSILSNELDALQ